MCIRDSYNTTQLQAGIYYENVGIGNGSTPIVSSAYARNAAIGSFPNQGVHLDTNAYLRKNLKSSQGTLIAVSYTHLDVYKRQVLPYPQLHT